MATPYDERPLAWLRQSGAVIASLASRGLTGDHIGRQLDAAERQLVEAVQSMGRHDYPLHPRVFGGRHGDTLRDLPADPDDSTNRPAVRVSALRRCGLTGSATPLVAVAAAFLGPRGLEGAELVAVLLGLLDNESAGQIGRPCDIWGSRADRSEDSSDAWGCWQFDGGAHRRLMRPQWYDETLELPAIAARFAPAYEDEVWLCNALVEAVYPVVHYTRVYHACRARGMSHADSLTAIPLMHSGPLYLDFLTGRNDVTTYDQRNPSRRSRSYPHKYATDKLPEARGKVERALRALRGQS